MTIISGGCRSNEMFNWQILEFRVCAESGIYDLTLGKREYLVVDSLPYHLIFVSVSVGWSYKLTKLQITLITENHFIYFWSWRVDF